MQLQGVYALEASKLKHIILTIKELRCDYLVLFGY